MTTPFPPGKDREAARRWLRERNPAVPVWPTPTHGGLLRDQRDRLLTEAGFPLPPGFPGAARIDVALDGPAVIDHSASLSMLGAFFTSFQSTITAVAQALEGTPTTAGQVAGYITLATQLRSVAAFPSSYGLHLHGPDTSVPGWEQSALPFSPDDDEPLPRGSTSELLTDAVGALLDIADLAQGQEADGSQEPLLEKLVPLGQRALGHLTALTSTLVAHDVSLKVTWQPHTERARTGSLSAGAAAMLKGLSEGVRFSEPDRRRLEGELIEASLRRGSVAIELDSGTIVNARTEPAATSRLRDDLLGKRVVADSLVTVAHYAGGRQRETYVVTDISPADR